MSNYSDTEQPVVEVRDEAAEYWEGYYAYHAGFDVLTVRESKPYERGWWDALQHEEDTDDYEDWMLEIAWLREGC